MSLLLVLGCALLGGAGGAAVPALVRRLPQPDPASLHLPEGEDPPPTYAEVAAAPGLARRTAVVGALAAGLLAWSVGAEPALVGLVAVVPVAVALGAVDLRTRLLPKVLVLPATAWLVAVAAVAALLGGPAETDALVRSLVALVAARTAYWLLWFVRSAGLGFGDVRLAAMVGAGLGQLGWAEVLVGLYAGFLVFGVPGALWALVRRDRSLLRAAYPFGPFLLLGALLGVLLGDVVAGALGWA
ncbi:hypothetical protein ENKNEFLB_02762 [Nocardioides aquaticus]|uniref:Prepilin type IV endopeptidase peptidase domain-containing protein n=1 Tax=Nocardioides aquaticus TaxID=160826 RepID=A0ABX8EIL9_9ACTN|nr:A24 family peptidase [Nocardioides aquaticus]QVT80367.1 hypothetical protein ENKNEFLB_02762 [Nocardioides aquaticus]